MKSYSIKELLRGLKAVGVKKGDLLYLVPEIFKFGQLKQDQKFKNPYEIFYKCIKDTIGPSGTLCINTYTFDTLRHKKKFIYESKFTTCGGFSDLILSKKNVVRSLHPVFSVASIGKKAKFICSGNSQHNYGYNSPYEKFLRLNGKILNLGQNYWSNPFSHVAEYMIGASHYFNKFTNVEYFKNGKKRKKNFSSFVRFLSYEIIDIHKKLKLEIDKSKIVKKFKLGDGYIYCLDAQKYLKICLDILSKDQFSFIKKEKFINSQKKLKI